MLLLIFSIVVLISGKFYYTKTFGLKGGIARFTAILLILPVPVFFNQNDMIGLLIQVAWLFLMPLVVILVHGNDLAKDTDLLILPRHPFSEELVVKYEQVKKTIIIGLLGTIAGYAVIALTLYLSGDKIENMKLYWQIFLTIGLLSLLSANVVAVISARKACSILDEPFKRYAMGIPILSIFIWFSGPLITIRLLIPIQRTLRQFKLQTRQGNGSE
ncbi:MAG: hypothetical protein P9M14_18245 [Candidatus Alcyoniella australis]|nr:hypothetical protein [Candidatus Alcyoniella australis]